MKKFASVGASLLTVVVALALMAGPADARSHRHHRHHRGGGGGGGGITCGPGTVNVGGVCVPTGTPVPVPPPIGSGNFQINPSSVHQLTNGSFNTIVTGSGLPALFPGFFVNITSLTTACPGTTLTGSTATDAAGVAQFTLSRGPAAICPLGSYPITFTEPVSPFQSFTAFVSVV